MNPQLSDLDKLLREWPQRPAFASLWKPGGAAPTSQEGARAVLQDLLRPGRIETALEALLREKDLEPAHRLVDALEHRPLKLGEATALKSRLRQVERLRALERKIEGWTRASGEEGDPILAPRLAPPLPYSEPAAILLEWMLEPPGKGDAPPGFASHWSLDSDDTIGRALAEAVLNFVRDAPTRTRALAVAQALARGLGVAQAASNASPESDHRIHLSLSRHPMTLLTPGMQRSDIRLVVPFEVDGTESLSPGVQIHFDPLQLDPSAQAGTLRLSLETLLACLPEKTSRAERLARELARQLPLTEILPARWSAEQEATPRVGEEARAALRNELLRVFHAAGVSIASSALSLLLYLGGDVPRLAARLIELLFARLAGARGRRYGPVLRSDVLEVWWHEDEEEHAPEGGFNQAMKSWFSQVGESALLAIFLLDARTAPSLEEMPSLTQDMLLENLTQGERATLETGLARLSHFGLIEQEQRRNEAVYRLSRTGPVWWKLRSLQPDG